MNSLTYLRECQTPSRWHSFRMLSRKFPSSVLLKLWMNAVPPLLGMGHLLTSTTHPTTTSSSMLVLGMMQPIHQLLPKEGMYMQLLVPKISPLLRNPTKHSSLNDTIYIKTQVFRLLRYYSPAPRNIARSDWATQNITHNMTSSKT